MLITGETIIGDLLDSSPKLDGILREHGMHCPGCPAARGETLKEACEVHGLDLHELLLRLESEK